MKNTNWIMTIILGCAFLSSAVFCVAQDWPQWRGLHRDAKASVFTAPKTWPKELSQKWKVAVGDGVATPALLGDKLYVFARQEGREVIRCLDAATGGELWKEEYDEAGATGAASRYSGPRSSPTVADGRVITLGVRGVLSCFDADTGKLQWRQDDFRNKVPRFFVSSSPLVADGLCVAQLGDNDNGGIFAYDLATGDEKWKWTGDAPAYASPVLMDVGGDKLVVGQTNSKMVALTLADGKLVWETPFAGERRAYNASTPIVAGATIIYGGSNRGTTAVKLEKSGDALAAKELWTNKDNSVQFNTPVLRKGFLVGLSASNEFFCISASDGKTAWTAPLSAVTKEAERPADGGGRRRRGGRGGYGSIVDAGSVLLALTPASQLVVFEPNPKSYTELARIKVADSPVYAYPIASGNRIFVKDRESVILYSLQADE